MEPNENALAILTKNPVKGKVKTKIAKQVGETVALKVYLQLLKQTRLTIQDLDFCEKKLFYDEFIPSRDNWSEEYFEKFVQEGNNLGERLGNAYQMLFDEGFDKVVIISPDCPDITGLRVKQAFTLLNNKDFVLGPLRDGGYYLLGMKRHHPGLLEGISFEDGQAFQKTVEAIEKLGASYKVLTELYDVDEAQEVPDRLRQIVGLEPLESYIEEDDDDMDDTVDGLSVNSQGILDSEENPEMAGYLEEEEE